MPFNLFKITSTTTYIDYSTGNFSNFGFIALDVETANKKYWSVCQVGLAYFKGDEVVGTWQSHVNPDTEFNDFNISLHGITPAIVKQAPSLSEIYQLLLPRLKGNIVVHHTHADKTALDQIARKIGEKEIPCRWLDSAKVARRAWESAKERGYGLDDLSEMLHIQRDKPHDALDDAITAGRVLLKAIADTNIPLAKWSRELEDTQARWKRERSELHEAACLEPNADGPLFGEVVVFTGELCIPRLQAAQTAYALGCNIDERVTRKTTLLVVGDQDLSLLAGHDKSTKHRYAEELIAKGVQIRIIGESDFMAMLA